MAEIIQIDSRTWRLEDGFVRFFLLEGETQAAMIDSGVDSPDALRLAQTLTEKPILLINTHGDRDHISGTGAFREIRMHALDHLHCGVGAAFPGTALVELHDGDIIDLGNRPLKVLHIPGHTKGSLAFLDARERVLYAGDSVQKGHIYMFGKKRDPERFESSLDRLISLKGEYDRVFASHDVYCVPNDHPEKVKAVWQQVRSGQLPYELTEMLGQTVRCYTADDCGFFVEN